MIAHPTLRTLVLAAALLSTPPAPAGASGQERPSAPSPEREAEDETAPTNEGLEVLVAEALRRNPAIRAARADAEATEARVPAAGAWEDPVLTFGFMNLRTTSFDFGDDFMTMKLLQVGQRIPLPGQLAHRRAAAEGHAEAARHRVAQGKVEVSAGVKEAFAKLYYLDRALEITERNRSLLSALERVTLTRYSTGVGAQPAVLRAGLEIDALQRQQVALEQRRRAALATLNELLHRRPDTPLERTVYPAALLTLVEGADAPAGSAFVSALEPRGRAQPQALPSLDSLIERALREKPALHAHVARIGAQEEALRLARSERWPAPRLTLGYAQRDGFDDMLNATVSFSVPIFLGAKQNALVGEEESGLARERARHAAMVDEIRREVTEAYAGVADAYGQLAVFRSGILTRAEANLDATLAAYRSGAEDFLALLDSQASLHRQQLEYHRRLADLLSAWADLERAVGEEIQP